MVEETVKAENSCEENNANKPERLGLALSGGGFRASLYHIGVLMALAETGLLHKVEVISTVSGGSIIGALYYLRLKQYLEDNEDLKFCINKDSKLMDRSRKEYIKLVEQVKTKFLEGMEVNIRTRVLSNLAMNFRMCSPRYSRSDRVASLYDKYFYGDKKIELRKLKIIPKGEKCDFNPKYDNKHRCHKVPMLVINATTLNTGHNWRFRAKNMGETPSNNELEVDVDKNMRLRRPKSWQKTVKVQEDFSLKAAVAASACVPGLFHPLAISGMYEKIRLDGESRDIRVQLIDGGVHDNLGIKSLEKLDCTQYIVSDASGHLKDIANPSTNIFSTLARMNSIALDRIREEEIFYLFCKYGCQNIAFVHLRRGIPPRVVHYKTPDNEERIGDVSGFKEFTKSEDFGVCRKVQYRLSGIRTDLDSFSEIESESLIQNAYRMTRHELKKKKDVFAPDLDAEYFENKTFTTLFENPSDRYLKHLEVAGKNVFKVFSLVPCYAWPSAILIFGGGGFLLWYFFSDQIHELWSQFWGITLGELAPTLLGLLGFGLFSLIPKALRFFKKAPKLGERISVATHLITRSVLGVILWIGAWIHLWVFDRLFRYAGRIKRLENK